FNKDFGKKRPHSLPQEKKEPDRLRYPSQNPYDKLRPKEPALPKGLSWDMLSSSDKDALRSLSREHAENVGLHILAAYELEGEDLPLALEHAKWAASNASRIDIARECLALMAYRSQDFKTALKEFLTVRRLNGESDWIPFIADCYRGLGEPQKAIETIRKESPDASAESKLEMMLVMAGAFADLKDTERALKIIRSMKALPGLPLSYRLRACEAEQTFLFMAGKKKEADAMEKEIEDMESKVFPEEEEEEGLVDFDLENLDERVIEDLLS
ncbi:MAG: helicase, partial [Aeriscardovia sp.]|nr:helicase [Aeriscardovia sp.]